MKKRKLIVIPILLLCILTTLLLPNRSVVQNEETFEIHAVTLYYKGQPKENLSEYLKLNSLELCLELYKTSILPTVKRGQEYEAYYYVIEGSDNDKLFTITADSNGAFLFYADKNLGYRFRNGHILKSMILTSAYDEFREQIQSLIQ